MSKFLKIVRFAKEKRSLFESFSKIAEIDKNMRESGPIGKILGACAIAFEITDGLFPSDSPWDYFDALGMGCHNSPISGMICEVILGSGVQRKSVASFSGSEGFLLEFEGIEIGVIMNGTIVAHGPFLFPGNYENLFDKVSKFIWRKSRELVLISKQDGGSGQRSQSESYSLTPISPPGPYLSCKNSPKDYADRLRRYSNEESRSVLIKGPTGIGKSVFARHLAFELAGESSKTLKIPSSVIHNCQPDELLYIVRLLRPTILLLDDVSLDDRGKTDKFLALLELLREPECLVVATMMTDYANKKISDLEMGDLHFPGMRPGRIDEIICFQIPDKDDRKLILSHYLPGYQISDELVKMTSGLTGAYLSEVARRIRTHGEDNWRQEVRSVILTAPKYFLDEKDDKR